MELVIFTDIPKKSRRCCSCLQACNRMLHAQNEHIILIESNFSILIAVLIQTETGRDPVSENPPLWVDVF